MFFYYPTSWDPVNWADKRQINEQTEVCLHMGALRDE